MTAELAAPQAVRLVPNGDAEHSRLRLGAPVPGTVEIAVLGLALIVGLVVLSTAVGGGDFGQWLMVSRLFDGGPVPAYRDLTRTPPLVPIAIALATAVLGDPMLALRAVAGGIAVALAMAFAVAGWALDGRRLTGLLAAVAAVLVSDQLLDLLAFGGLPQAAAIALATLAVAAFMAARRSSARRRPWWVVGVATLLATCLTHAPTSTIAVPTVAVAALLAVGTPTGRSTGALRAWLRPVVPLGVGLAAVGAYWLVVVVPASATLVTNPASLAYRGPDRLVDIMLRYPPTAALMATGAVALGAWAVRVAAGLGTRGRGEAIGRHDAWPILLAWAAVSWASFGWSGLTGASTDYPRFAPILIAPLAVAAAGGIAAVVVAGARRIAIRRSPDRGLLAVGVAILLVAPFTIARYQTDAHGYELPDAVALETAAAWIDARVAPGTTVLAPVREAKWVEGLTGRSTLFSSDIRYAFRSVEWQRSLAADALLRSNLTLVNEAFVVSLNDGIVGGGVPATGSGSAAGSGSATGSSSGVGTGADPQRGPATPAASQQPRGLLLSVNHGGEYLDLLRLLPDATVIEGPDGQAIARLSTLQPAGFDRSTMLGEIATSLRWSAVRQKMAIDVSETMTLDAGSATFHLALAAATPLPVSRLELGLRPATGAALMQVLPVAGSTSAVDLMFARAGTSAPRLRVSIQGGTIQARPDGELVASVAGTTLHLDVTALTVGGASSGLQALDPPTLVDQYGIGAVLLRRDAAFGDRRERLESLGFHDGLAVGPYVVMVRDGFGVPAR